MVWLVLGVAGVTCGGKTTLARALADWADSLQGVPGATRVVAADRYFRHKSDGRHVRIVGTERTNWELNSSIDTGRIFLDMEDILHSPGTKGATGEDRDNLLLVEGHTVLNCPLIASLCHLKYFFVLPQEECHLRRSGRDYGKGPDKTGYFDMAVWPSYLAHFKEVQETIPDVKIIDGTWTVEEIVESVKEDIRGLGFGN